MNDDVPSGAVLHSPLTLNKTGGGKSWVITAITANDITVDFYPLATHDYLECN